MRKKVGGESGRSARLDGEAAIGRRRFLTRGAAAATGLAALGAGLSRAGDGATVARRDAEPAPPRAQTPVAAPSLPEPASPQTFSARIEDARGRLRAAKLPAMVVGAGIDLQYLTGLELERGDRPVFLVLPVERDVELICPWFLEQSLVASPEVIQTVHSWQDDEDPLALLEGRLGKAGVREGPVAVGGAPLADDVERLRKKMPSLSFENGSPILGAMRRAKSAHEIACLEAAAAIALHAVESTLSAVQDGMAEEEIAAQVAGRIREAGAAAAAGQVHVGPPSAVPYAPWGHRRLAAGNVILVEFAAQVRSYWGGVSRAAVRGTPTARHKLVYGALLKTREQVLRTASIGRQGADLDTLARGLLENDGLRRGIRHRLGQGAGLERRERPIVSLGSEDRFVEGDVVSIEPGVYTPKDCGIRIGDLVEIAAAGARCFTRPPPALPEI